MRRKFWSSRTLVPKQGRSWFKVRLFEDRVTLLHCGLWKCCRHLCRKANAAFPFAESPSPLTQPPLTLYPLTPSPLTPTPLTPSPLTPSPLQSTLLPPTASIRDKSCGFYLRQSEVQIHNMFTITHLTVL